MLWRHLTTSHCSPHVVPRETVLSTASAGLSVALWWRSTSSHASSSLFPLPFLCSHHTGWYERTRRTVTNGSIFVPDSRRRRPLSPSAPPLPLTPAARTCTQMGRCFFTESFTAPFRRRDYVLSCTTTTAHASLSFEVMPAASLYRDTVDRLLQVRLDFITRTYGAGRIVTMPARRSSASYETPADRAPDLRRQFHGRGRSTVHDWLRVGREPSWFCSGIRRSGRGLGTWLAVSRARRNSPIFNPHGRKTPLQRSPGRGPRCSAFAHHRVAVQRVTRRRARRPAVSSASSLKQAAARPFAITQLFWDAASFRRARPSRRRHYPDCSRPAAGHGSSAPSAASRTSPVSRSLNSFDDTGWFRAGVATSSARAFGSRPHPLSLDAGAPGVHLYTARPVSTFALHGRTPTRNGPRLAPFTHH